MAQRIYMDHHATTPCDPRVVEAMAPYWTDRFGNPASAHLFGWEAAEAVRGAQEQVAALLGCDAKEIVFTSGATESNNLAILGSFRVLREKGRHLVLSAFEHPSARAAALAAEAEGAEISWVRPEPDGIVRPEAIAEALREDTILCSVLWAHNEIGTIQPIAEISTLCRARGVLLHSDATQALARIAVDAREVDLLSLSGHKMYGPKGIGALYLRRRRPRVRVAALLHGGEHQGGVRSGTLPVPLIVGLGEAARLLSEERDEESRRVARLGQLLLSRLQELAGPILVNGAAGPRLPGSWNLSFLGVEAEAMLLELPGLGLSPGSACSAQRHEPSDTLLLLGRTLEEAYSSLRFGLGRSNTEAEVEQVAADLARVAQELRQRSLDASSHHGGDA